MAFEEMRIKTQKCFHDIRYKHKGKIKNQKIMMLKDEKSAHGTSAF